MLVTIFNSQQDPVAFAMRVSHGGGTCPWIEVTDINLTEAGRRLYGSPLRLLVGEVHLVGEDGLSFVGCKATGFYGPGVPVRFLAGDIVDANGASIVI